MSDDEYAYLQPGFDPSTFTVPRLRSVLVAHDVSYPSSAKKADLIELFNDNVAKNAKRIRSAQARTKRSSKGIVSVSPGGRAIDAGHDEDAPEDDEVAPLATPARKPSRKNIRAATEEAVGATPRTARSKRQSTVPLSATKPSARAADDSDGAQDALKVPKSRKTRHSISPAVKHELEDERAHDDHASPFTQDNPFQSGSPDRLSEFASPARRRTTQGASLNHEKPKQKSNRRRTDGNFADRNADSMSFNVPRSSIKVESESDVSAGEEFTPDQQLELETALAGDRTVARRRKTSRSGAAKVGTWSVLIALLGGAATVWRQEKLNVGYCGIGSPSTSVGGVEIPEWASTLQPKCEPCPQHAYCYADLKTVCEPDFVLTPHPLSLGGLVPLPPTCEPDGEKAKRIKAVADFAVEKELREHNAKFECGEVKQAEVKVEELKTSVASKRSRKMSDEEFDELWASALDEIMGRDEITTRNDG